MKLIDRSLLSNVVDAALSLLENLLDNRLFLKVVDLVFDWLVFRIDDWLTKQEQERRSFAFLPFFAFSRSPHILGDQDTQRILILFVVGKHTDVE